MDTLNFLYISLGIAIWIIIGSTVLLAVFLLRILENLRVATKSLSNVAMNYEIIKGGIKLGVLNYLNKALKIFIGGGENNGKK